MGAMYLAACPASDSENLGEMLCCVTPSVAMVQATEPRHRNHARRGRRSLLDWPLVGSVLVQRVMNSIFVMIRYVVTDYPEQVLFAQRDHVIEDFAAAADYPPFR